jgi:sec-independent protein translocase protein TatB
MFGLSLEHLVILLVAGLFIFGPERLPGAAATLGRTIRKVHEYAATTRDQIEAAAGPEFEELRRPLRDLAALRRFDTRAAITRYLFDDAIRHVPASTVPPDHQPLATGGRTPIDLEAT